MTESLTVNLGERSYSLHFGQALPVELKARVQELATKGKRIAVIIDRQLLSCQAEVLGSVFGDHPRFAVEPGESSKSLQRLGEVLDFLAEHRLDRSSMIFAVGGGIVGDLAGFAAATYLRGVEFIQVPTTLLAMVDSSVGGKTGINLKAGKNLVGAFHQPKAVYISTEFLSTLPPREFAAGMAEVIKYGLLGDAALFQKLESAPLSVRSSELASVIRTCCALKARIVEADERELAQENGRALLNLGHTFGHAIEQVTGYGEYLHGEAVAIGLAAAVRLSHKLGLIGSQDISRVERVLSAHQLPVRLRAPLPLSALLAAVGRDKKVRSGLPRFVVLNAVGNAATRADIEPAWVDASFREVGAI